jgi:hypothetical protein
MSHRTRRALRNPEYAENVAFEFPPRRQARRGDRWSVRRSPHGTWLAGPKTLQVFVDPACTRRYFEFTTWRTAITFAYQQAAGRR